MNLLRTIAGLPATIAFAVRMKRLSDRIIRRHMQCEFDDATRNGENWIVSVLAPSCGTFADVGANRGDFTAAFLAQSPRATGILFDPAAGAVDKLQQRFRGDSRVRILRKAVSDSVGRMAFYEEPDAGLGSSLVASCAGQGAVRTEVDVTTLDAEIGGDRSAEYVKIDAEGHDLAAIRGAREHLASHSIRFLQFEYHHTWAAAGATLKAALNLLSENGYSTYLIKGEALYETNYETYGEYLSYSNYLAVAPEFKPQVLRHVKGRI